MTDTDTLRKLAEVSTNIEKTIANWSLRQIAEHIAEFEASDTALRAKVKALEEALEPFAAEGRILPDDCEDRFLAQMKAAIGNLRRAAKEVK